MKYTTNVEKISYTNIDFIVCISLKMIRDIIYLKILVNKGLTKSNNCDI